MQLRWIMPDGELLPYIYAHYRKTRKGENVGWISKLYMLKTEDFFFHKLLLKYVFS